MTATGPLPRPPMVAVCGAGVASPEEARDAAEVGRLLAEAGVVVVCGGLGGVMEAAAAGASTAGGVVVGLLPGLDAADAAPGVTVALPTGLDEMRNLLVVRAAAAVVAVGGAYGTLTEVAFALRLGRPVAALRSWEVRRPGTAAADPAVHVAASPEDAVDHVLARIGHRRVSG